LVHIARAAHWSPSWLTGAPIRGVGPNGRYDGDRLILELDESYGTFEHVVPQGLAVLNIEADHLDHYGTLDSLIDSFRSVIERTLGPVVVWSDDVPERSYHGLSAHTVGTTELATYVVDRVVRLPEGTSFRIRGPQLSLDLVLSVVGQHNVANAATVAVLAHLLGAPSAAITTGLAAFSGAPRRYERRGRLGEAEIIDDFAHLPREIATTLRTAREGGAKSILAVFQPHRFSRTAHLVDEFGQSFGDATHVVVTDIYGAGEANDSGVSGERVAAAISSHRATPATYCHTLVDVEHYVREVASDYDTIIFLGAGDISRTVDALGDRRVD
jgi:UDP-N-acetylmuramate--alanine ligase